jgi:hypothetical protein
MSTVILDTITGKSTATTITIGSTPVVSASANSMTIRGEGSAQTSIQQGLAKAWFNLNAATPALRDSFNITNVTDEGTGFYEGNFTSAMSNGDYSVSGSMSTKSSGNSYSGILTTGDEANTYGLHSTASIRVNIYTVNFSTQKDPSMVQANVNGDLA